MRLSSKFAVFALLIMINLACAVPSDAIVSAPTARPTRTPLPTFTPTTAVQATIVIPPTSTNTPLPTDTSTPEPPTNTPMPTDTPAPQVTEEPTATNTPEPAPTKAPQAASRPTDPPAPTDTPVPAAPAGGAHGVIGKLTLRDGKTTFASGEKIFVKIEAQNTTGSAIQFGILGLTTSDGAFQTSWDRSAIEANSTFRHEDGVAIGGPGNKKIYLSICFSTKEECQAGGDWERFEPGVDVVVQ